MGEKVMKNIIGELEQEKLFNEKSIKDPVPKRNKHNSGNEKNINRRGKADNKSKENTLSQKSSLDKVAADIENILGQLNVFSTENSKPSEPIQLKIVHKEFFKTGRNTDKKEGFPQKPSNSKTKGKVSNFSKLPRISLKAETINKLKCSVVPETSHIASRNSNQGLRKIPITKSELQNFKHNIILNTNRVFKSPEKIKYPDKEKVARNVKMLIEAALKKSEHEHKPPVIDIENFIHQSLKLAIPDDFPELKQIMEKKTTDSCETDSESDWSVKLNTLMKKTVEQEEKETEKEENRIKEKINMALSKETDKLNNSIIPSAQSQNNDVRIPKKTENDAIKNKTNLLLHPTVQTFKAITNNSHTYRGSSRTKALRYGQSKTTGNLLAPRKLPPTRSTVNMKSISQKNVYKVSSKQSTNRAGSPNRFVNTKQVKNINSQDIGNNKKNLMRCNNRTRSNSTLEIIAKNDSSIMQARPSSAKSNSTTASKLSGMNRNGSICGEMKFKIISAPERISSSGQANIKSHFSKKNSSNSCFGPFRSPIATTNRQTNPIKQLREEVNRAIIEGKTFTVRGNHTAVRRALLKRGWIERLHITNAEKLEHQMNWIRHSTLNQLEDMLHVKDLNEICKKLIKSKLLASHQVDLYWGPNYDSFTINPDKVKLTKINKFRRDVFSYTSKQGLCDAAKDAHWFNFPGLANIKHPRTYVLARNGETNDFIKDFRRTAAMSLLKWIIRSHEARDCKIVSSSGKVPLEAFQFAANECCKIVIETNNEDIDYPLKEASDYEWDQFLEYYYKILHIGNHFKSSNLETESTIVEKSAYLIKKLSPHHPHIKMDGTMNIWILKPAVGSQGKGIHICRTLQYIMRTVKNNKNIRYISQKYIERPLLIFNTKFDIRQWFLISSAVPLTIWMYKECYLRFSSQTYNLRKLHESIHLTNNSVQQRYQNTSHDITLPNYNMWDSQQFKNYLSNIGFPDVYNRVTYKGMKECVIGSVLIHQDKIDKRRNSFELYGADFMLTEDFQPWLIEINSSPALYASTPVTSRMCPQVLEDTIKVVVDFASNPKARTGNFELIYRQENLPNKCNVNLQDLKVSGKPLPNNYFYCDEEKIGNESRILSENLRNENDLSQSKSEIMARTMKATLEGLLQFIQKEKRKRQIKRLIAKGTDPIKSLDKNMKGTKSSSTSTNKPRSFTDLKSKWEQFFDNSEIPIAEEDVDMIDEALNMLKLKKNSEMMRYLLDIIEKVLNKSTENKI